MKWLKEFKETLQQLFNPNNPNDRIALAIKASEESLKTGQEALSRFDQNAFDSVNRRLAGSNFIDQSNRNSYKNTM